MDKVGEDEKRLLETALKGMRNAYVLWGFAVGAAVLAEDGRIYEGCNVESWVSGLGICAERCAINHAILHGNRKIEKVAVVMDAKSQSEPKPCGACLQYINDFAKSSKIEIVMAKARSGEVLFETVRVKTLKELLPSPFRK
ncbi:MAG: cytidine deaminase [Candidatus Bathycorpusculaceae bacterium]